MVVSNVVQISSFNKILNIIFFSASFFPLDRSESLSGALDGCYSYDGEQNQWNLYTTLKKPRYRFSHVMINKDTMWLTGKYFG